VDCYIWYSEEGPGRAAAPPSPLLAVPNVTAHPSTASVPTAVLLYGGPLLCGFNVVVKGLTFSNASTQRAQTPPMLKCQPNVMRVSNPDFRINPDPDPHVCRIAHKMLWIYCPAGVSHFATFRKNRRVTVCEMVRNRLKSSVPQ